MRVEQAKRLKTLEQENARLKRLVAEKQLALKYWRYGYGRISVLLRNEGWQVNHKRIEERLWRKEGLKVVQCQPKRGRLWLGRWVLCSTSS